MNESSYKITISPGGSLSKAWQSVTANLGPFIGFTILYFIATSIFNAIPFIGWLTSFFQFIMTVSVFSGLDYIDRNRKLSFSNLLDWTPKFGRLLGASVITFFMSLILFAPLVIYFLITQGTSFVMNLSDATGRYAAFRFAPVSVTLITLIYGFIGLVVLCVYTFAFFFLIQFSDIPVMEALKLSFRIGKENFGRITVFLFLAIGVIILGVLALLLGVLVAIPLVIGMQYYMMRSIIPADETGKWDFEKHA
jgi:hypothetical protein